MFPFPWRFLFGLVVTAVGASAFAVGFRQALYALFHTVTGANDVVTAVQWFPASTRMFVPMVGGLLAGLASIASSWLPSSHGVGDVMEAVVLGRVRLSIRVTLLKCAGSFAAISTGGSLGREGPLIQFGAAFGQAAGRLLATNRSDTRVLVAAGTAAGFAAAYNAPLSGVLFVVEVVMGVVVLETLAPVLASVVLGTVVSHVLGGDAPLFGHRAFGLSQPADLPALVVLGGLSAVGGHYFLRFLSLGDRVFHQPWLALPWRPALGALCTGIVLSFVPLVAGNGGEPIIRVLNGVLPLDAIALLILAKLIATTTSVASGCPGGVFTPTMLLGGGIGTLYASALVALHVPVGVPQAYTLAGMAAAVAGTTHAPMMAAVLMFEMTTDYAMLLPMLLSTSVAVVVARRLSRESLYTKELLARGVRWRLDMEGGRIVEREELVAGGEGI